MRISIITCSRVNNYGALLQTFALCRYVFSLGHSVQVIDYRPSYLEFCTRLWYCAGFDIKEWCKMVLRWRNRATVISKYRGVSDFANRHVPFTIREYRSIDELRTDPPMADVYIAGSDQIWNPELPNGTDEAFYLDFGPSSIKRISYAASFGVETMSSGYCYNMEKMLSNLDAVSVREESGQRICSDYGVRSVLVCDPVLLLPSGFWMGIADESCVPECSYLLVYDLMKSRVIERTAKMIARHHNLRIISVSPYWLSYAHNNYGDCTPAQFLGLIKNAGFVLCNSYHGCLYSLIFNRDFLVVERTDGLNTRMREFLYRYGLAKLLIKDERSSYCEHIDYYNISKAMDADICFSRAWLSQQLS